MSLGVNLDIAEEIDEGVPLFLGSVVALDAAEEVETGVELPFTYASTLLQVKRGVDANLPSSFAMGEPAFTTDTNRFFIGTGSGRVEAALQGRAFTPQHMTDAAAANDTLYYSTTQNKLVYKDSGGTVNVLY